MRLRRALIAMGVLLAVALAVAYAAAQSLRCSLAAPKPGDSTPCDTIIEPKSSVRRIARQLHQEGLIRDERAFRLAARYLELDQRLQAGGYRFTRSDGSVAILKKLAAGKVYVCKFTVPEGLTIDEVAQRVEEAGIGSAKTFRGLASGDRRLEGRPKWAPQGSLEGYLYPETYQVPLGMSESDLVKMMLSRFEETVVEGMAEELKAQSLSLHDVVILASIVEREAKIAAEQPLMAAVFLRRLELGMRLESCATVQYALPERKERLLYADLKIASPYNTYLHDGLPPGPIASCGSSAVRAVLHPADSSVLYFVARADGSHVFSETLAQHNAAKKAIKRAARQPKP